MRFTIYREDFLKPLRAVAGVVERKHTQTSPILLNVLIKVHDNEFFLATTDQEVEIVARGQLPEPAVENGAVTVSVRKLLDICKTLPSDEKLLFLEEQNRVTLRVGRSRFTLSTLPASEFPNLSENIGNVEFSIKKKDLKLLMEQTCFAMADQDVRYYLNGMLLELKDNQVYGVAADGHRLAFNKVALKTATREQVRVIVPRKGILELQRIVDESEEEVRIIIGSNHIRAITSDIQLTSKLLEGRFPDYERIVSAAGSKTLVGPRTTLKESFQRAATLFNDRFKGIHLQLSPGFLKVLATNPEQDEVEESVEVNYTGEELEIGFNVRYLIDFLNVIDTDEIKFTLSDANSSARIEGIGAKNGIYIIMPMKI